MHECIAINLPSGVDEELCKKERNMTHLTCMYVVDVQLVRSHIEGEVWGVGYCHLKYVDVLCFPILQANTGMLNMFDGCMIEITWHVISHSGSPLQH